MTKELEGWTPIDREIPRGVKLRFCRYDATRETTGEVDKDGFIHLAAGFLLPVGKLGVVTLVPTHWAPLAEPTP